MNDVPWKVMVLIYRNADEFQSAPNFNASSAKERPRIIFSLVCELAISSRLIDLNWIGATKRAAKSRTKAAAAFLLIILLVFCFDYRTLSNAPDNAKWCVCSIL